MTSILESLAKYERFGHTPRDIGNVTIGRTVYAAGRFTHADGEPRMVLIPIYRTDWESQPALLPPSHKRGAVYVIDGEEWFITGWNAGDRTVWLSRVTHPETFTHPRTGNPYRRVTGLSHWTESFECAMRLAGPAVLERINTEA